MGCAGSKSDLVHNDVLQAMIDGEKEKIQQRHAQQVQAVTTTTTIPNNHISDNRNITNKEDYSSKPRIDNTPEHNIEPDNGFSYMAIYVPDYTSALNNATTEREQAPKFAKQASAANLVRLAPLPPAPPPSTVTTTTISSTNPKPSSIPTPQKETISTHINNKKKPGFAHHLRNVFAKPLEEAQVSSFMAPRFDKSKADVEFLRKAMTKNFVFTNLSEKQWKIMLDAFEEVRYSQDKQVVIQGEEEDYFFVVRNGKLHFEVDGIKGDVLEPGQSFGELALLYDSPRAASVISDSDSVLFRVDQKTFRYIMQTQRELAEYDKKVLLRGVAFLKDMDETDLSRLAEAMIPRQFAMGETLATKGDPADTFFIIQEGKVRVTDFDAGQTRYQDHDLGPGDYFGESALIKEERRAATFRGKSKGVVISIEKSQFQENIGDFSDLVQKSQDRKMLAAIHLIQNTYLTGASLANLASRIVDRTIPPHTEVARQGAGTPAALYLVREGRVEFTREDGRGHRIVEEGGYFGEDTLIADWNATVDELTSSAEVPPYVTSKFTISTTDNGARLGVLTLVECRVVIDTTMIGKGRRTDFTSIVDEDIPLLSLKKHSLLGVGTFGQVWLTSKVAPDGTNRPYALKIQSKYELIKRNQAKGVVRERNLLVSLKSPFVIRLVQTYQDTHFIYMLLGLVQGGELYSLIYTDQQHGMSEQKAKFYAAGILEGLAYMHRRQIVYRDLKPENVLIAYGGYPVVVDLGFAKIVETKTYTLCGTPLYLAPEVILNHGHNMAADHWSCGILIFEMIAGYTPFYVNGMDQITLYRFVAKGHFLFPERTFSDQAIDFIEKILVTDPRKRLGSLAGGLDDIFQDPWLSSIEFSALRRKEIEAPWLPTITDPLDASTFKSWGHIRPKKKEDYPSLSRRSQEIFKDF